MVTHLIVVPNPSRLRTEVLPQAWGGPLLDLLPVCPPSLLHTTGPGPHIDRYASNPPGDRTGSEKPRIPTGLPGRESDEGGGREAKRVNG